MQLYYYINNYYHISKSYRTVNRSDNVHVVKLVSSLLTANRGCKQCFAINHEQCCAAPVNGMSEYLMKGQCSKR